nr:tissue factor pathway inhibitor-like [Procambarus clarkii]
MTNLKYLMLHLAAVIVCGQEVIPDTSNICFLPPTTGFCRAHFTSFFYNPETHACDCFVYGGCKGNENRFDTLDECMRTCNVLPSLQENIVECDKVFRHFNPLANKEVLDAIKDSVRPTQIPQDPTDPSYIQPAQQILQPAPQTIQPAPQTLQSLLQLKKALPTQQRVPLTQQPLP